jgi:hypothetical protein
MVRGGGAERDYHVTIGKEPETEVDVFHQSSGEERSQVEVVAVGERFCPSKHRPLFAWRIRRLCGP